MSDRSSAIGTFNEIVSGTKEAIIPSTEVLFSLFYQVLQDGNAEVYSNAALAIGLLVKHNARDLSALYGPILAILRPPFDLALDAPTSRCTARNNTVGSVSRPIVPFMVFYDNG